MSDSDVLYTVDLHVDESYSAQGFLSFMNGYTVFLGPFAGIMVTDVRPFTKYCDLMLKLLLVRSIG